MKVLEQDAQGDNPSTQTVARACVEREVKVRITVDGQDCRRDELVRCPDKERSVVLDDCRSCGRNSAIALGREGVVVRCRQDEPPALPGFNRLSNRPVTSVRVGELLTKPVLCVTGATDMGQADALWAEHGLQTICVVDRTGKLTGTLSSDFIGVSGRVEAHAQAVTVLVPEEAPALQVGAVLAYERVYDVPVVDAELRPVGMLTAFDVLGWIGREAGYLVMRD